MVDITKPVFLTKKQREQQKQKELEEEALKEKEH